MRIENYLGFPTGVSGAELAERATVQAAKFGADLPVATTVAGLTFDDGYATARLDSHETITTKCLLIATGARYRRPEIDALTRFEGRGVWYWASPIEARICSRQTVVIVGGGNSAGQAAVFLANHAAKVIMLIRGPGLAATMSRYLIDRIQGTANIELQPHQELKELEGGDSLEAVSWRDRRNGQERRLALQHLFMFIGAEPETGLIAECGLELDKAGFIITGRACACPLSEYKPEPLESSIPGVFAVGDVRSGSVKRVGGAIGEGAQVVASIHQYLARQDAARAERLSPAAVARASV